MKVLVTGGGGFLGNAVVGKLLHAGHDVLSFSRREHGNVRKLGAGSIRGNIQDKGDVLRAMEGMEAVVHTAAKVGYWGTYDEFHVANVKGTANIIDGCRKKGVSNLVFTSSPSVIFNGRDMEGDDESVPYPEKYDSHYSETKAEAERMVLKANGNGLRTISLRPHLIW
ncbi:MAG: NAD-dependent epimerase/dehydratase family protein, partial [Thermoplasmatota archaeon]